MFHLSAFDDDDDESEIININSNQGALGLVRSMGKDLPSYKKYDYQ